MLGKFADLIPSKERPADDAVAAVLATMASIDRDEFCRHFPESPRLKYLNFERFIQRDVAFCRLLGLDRSPPLRILDIGCGTGMFLHCAKHFGHIGVGIDVDDEFYRRMATMIGVDRRIEAVRPFVPLRIEGPFDLVTAIAATFDRLRFTENGKFIHQGTWGAKEWLFLMKDLERLLTPTGRIYLKLNKRWNEDRPKSAFSGTRRHLFDRAALAHAINGLTKEAGDGD